MLFVTTSSKRRALNILRFGAGLTNNFSAQMIYAAHLPEVLSSEDSITKMAFYNHCLEPIQLVRKPRYCQLGNPDVEKSGVIAQLSQKEFIPTW